MAVIPEHGQLKEEEDQKLEASLRVNPYLKHTHVHMHGYAHTCKYTDTRVDDLSDILGLQ